MSISSSTINGHRVCLGASRASAEKASSSSRESSGSMAETRPSFIVVGSLAREGAETSLFRVRQVDELEVAELHPAGVAFGSVGLEGDGTGLL